MAPVPTTTASFGLGAVTFLGFGAKLAGFPSEDGLGGTDAGAGGRHRPLGPQWSGPADAGLSRPDKRTDR